MLVGEWMRNGCVLWCNVKPVLREQLINVLEDPVFCEEDQLLLQLTGELHFLNLLETLATLRLLIHLISPKLYSFR